MSKTSPLNTLSTGVASLALVVLAACGGGSGGSTSGTTPPPSTPVSPTALDGTITGFGSVVIDGVRYDDSKAKVLFAKDPESAQAGSLADLRAGMRVVAGLSNGALDTVTVNFALIGPVGAVDTAASTFQVFGQTVHVNLSPAEGQLPTVLDGMTALSDLKTGDRVRVFGTVATDGSITASRVERRQPESVELLRASGAVQGLDSTAKTFELLGSTKLRIDFSNAKLVPAGASLANGKLVSVMAGTAPNLVNGVNVLQASKIEVKDRKWPDGQGASVGGVISAYQSLSSFRIGDLAVDGSAAKLTEGTTAADIANGAQALATGAITNGVMKADTLRVFKKETAIKALLIGQVTDFVSLSNFTLRGMTVDGSQAQFSKGQASDITSGAWLSVTGTFNGTVLVAKQIEVTPPPAAKPVSMAGSASGLDSAGKSFQMLGVKVQWSESTSFAPSGKTAAHISNGSLLRVNGSYDATSGVFTASRIEFLQPVVDGKVVSISGLVSALEGNTLKVGAASIVLNESTRFEPSTATVADLKPGLRVEVKSKISLSNGQMTLTALKIEIQKSGTDDQGHELQYLHGLIADFQSSASFTVAGQLVDASGANVEWIDGTAGKLANGLKVEIKGVLVDGVLKASRVHFMPD